MKTKSISLLLILVFIKTNANTNTDLSSFNSSQGFTIERTDSSASTFPSSGAGDVNGDGISDIIVAVPFLEPPTVYVLYGAKNLTASFTASSTTWDLTLGFKISGKGQFGSSMARAGDVNGDGIGDVIVGTKSGEFAYVIYGKKGGLNAHIDLSTTLNSIQGFMITGGAANDKFGFSVSTAGDVNGDGIDDVIIGANEASPNGRSRAGAGYVIYGQKGGLNAHIDLSTTLNLVQGFMITGGVATDRLGFSVSTAGDVNGDGIDDVIVGAPGVNSLTGAAYVVYGKKDGVTAQIGLNTALDSAQGFTIRGNATDDRFGCSVSRGDFNGDGISDVIVGANLADPKGLVNAGTPYVIYGKKDGFIVTINISTAFDSAQGFMIQGGSVAANLGVFVNGAGDVNGDGVEDVIFSGLSQVLYVIYSSCDIGYYFSSGGKCIDCSTPNCAKCTDTECQACKNGFSLYSSNGKCYATGACPPRTYENNSKCIDCSDANCDACTNAGCETCKNGFSLYSKNGKCYAAGACPPRTYENNSKCIDCSDANCDACTNAGCETCKNGFSLYLSTGKCYVTETCPSKTYEDNGKCIDCSDSNCDICTNIGCKTCKNGYVLDSVQRTCSACPLGTYEGNNKCLGNNMSNFCVFTAIIDCSDPNCNKCTDIECQGCKKGYLLDSEEGKCSSKTAALVNNSVVTESESVSDSAFFTPSTVVAIVLPVVEGIAIVFLAVQLIKLRTALVRRRPIRIEPVSTQVSPTPRLSTKSIGFCPSPRLSTKSGNYSPTNGA